MKPLTHSKNMQRSEQQVDLKKRHRQRYHHRTPYQHPRHQQQGMAVVEMTLVLPLMLLLMLAVSELGRMLYLYNELTQTQRDGARYLATQAFNGSSGVIDINEDSSVHPGVARNLIVYGNEAGNGEPVLEGFSTADVSFSALDLILSVSSPGDDHIQVDVTYTFTPLWGGSIPTFGLGPDIDVSFPLRSSLIMRAL